MKPKVFLKPDDLHEIRHGTNWKELWIALGIPRDLNRGSEDDWFGYSPFNPKEKTASFHMKTDPEGKGIWKDFSTDRGGGVIELVQELKGINCYEAGKWILEQELCDLDDLSRPRSGQAVREALSQAKERKSTERPANEPIRQDLRGLLETNHPAIAERGISPAVCKELGIGYLPKTSSSRLAGRVVFQIRGLDKDLKPVILSHMGRATTDEQISDGGKWHHYEGFAAGIELFNIDQVVLDPEAREQAQAFGLIIVEGCFDVAKLYEANIRNVVATFGSGLGDRIPLFKRLSEELGVKRYIVLYDRDKAGCAGAEKRERELVEAGFDVEVFDWEQSFQSNKRGQVTIPSSISDPCQMSVEHLRYLREQAGL